MVFGGGFGVLHSFLMRTESSITYTLSWIGFAVAIMTASAIAVLQAVDGIALKIHLDSNSRCFYVGKDGVKEDVILENIATILVAELTDTVFSSNHKPTFYSQRN
jgi:hypothetical protein